MGIMLYVCVASSCCGQLDEHIQRSWDHQSMRGVDCWRKTSARTQIVIFTHFTSVHFHNVDADEKLYDVFSVWCGRQRTD